VSRETGRERSRSWQENPLGPPPLQQLQTMLTAVGPTQLHAYTLSGPFDARDCCCCYRGDRVHGAFSSTAVPDWFKEHDVQRAQQEAQYKLKVLAGMY